MGGSTSEAVKIIQPSQYLRINGLLSHVDEDEESTIVRLIVCAIVQLIVCAIVQLIVCAIHVLIYIIKVCVTSVTVTTTFFTFICFMFYVYVILIRALQYQYTHYIV
jgi:uncharacterized membrane protein